MRFMRKDASEWQTQQQRMETEAGFTEASWKWGFPGWKFPGWYQWDFKYELGVSPGTGDILRSEICGS